MAYDGYKCGEWRTQTILAFSFNYYPLIVKTKENWYLEDR